MRYRRRLAGAPFTPIYIPKMPPPPAPADINPVLGWATLGIGTGLLLAALYFVVRDRR
jgi:hypothetical protein